MAGIAKNGMTESGSKIMERTKNELKKGKLATGRGPALEKSKL